MLKLQSQQRVFPPLPLILIFPTVLTPCQGDPRKTAGAAPGAGQTTNNAGPPGF